MAGLIRPDSGKVRLFGKKINDLQSNIGYVPQATNFDKGFPINVLEVVLMGKLNNKINFFKNFSSREKNEALNILKKLDIEAYKDRQIGELSGGQLQRVLLGRALAVDPDIMFLDEPTSSLDANATSEIYKILKELNKKITIVVITHDMAAVSSYFDSIACLNKNLYYHGQQELSREVVDNTYGCPINLIAHDNVHQTFTTQVEESDKND